MTGMLHENIVSQVMSDWGGIDRDVVDAVEPLLQDIVRSARAGAAPQEASELKVVILENYEWDANTQSVTSCKCPSQIPHSSQVRQSSCAW